MKKCKIAILDSGIDKIFMENKDIYCDGNVEDDNGHGTMCYSVIKNLASNTEFSISKILNKELLTSSEALLNKLKELLEKDIDIIHLSLSTNGGSVKKNLESICKKLQKSGKIIISSHDNAENENSYPCDFRSVIGVGGAIFETSLEFQYDETRKTQAFANKVPSLVKGLNGTYHFFGGTSKAAACMTGIIAYNWEKIKKRNYNKYLVVAAKESNRKKEWLVDPEVKIFAEREIMPYVTMQLNETNICKHLAIFEDYFQIQINYEDILLLDFTNVDRLSAKLSEFRRR